MALEQKLSIRMSQRLVMTPSLQQAIKLLQMSKLELVEEVQQELLENPTLEESQSDAAASEQPEAADREGEEFGVAVATDVAHLAVRTDESKRLDRGDDRTKRDVATVAIDAE